jgi:hypothetical protein
MELQVHVVVVAAGTASNRFEDTYHCQQNSPLHAATDV